jgi:hypothetical protein
MISTPRIRPSSLYRLIRCPGSLLAEAPLPPVTNKYASEGTAAHELAAMALEVGLPSKAFIGCQIPVGDDLYTVDGSMAADVQTYIDAIHECQKDGQLYVEHSLDFGPLVRSTNAKGTADAVILFPNEYQVHDLKFGKGVRVNAENNEQLAAYALGVINEFGRKDIHQVSLVIHQPRLAHISKAICSIDELSRFAEDAAHAIALASQPDAPRIPGQTQCRFCKAKPTCSAAADSVAVEFDYLTNE